ncbi:MAG: DUF262 domain-containing protein [Methanobacterium sp.]
MFSENPGTDKVEDLLKKIYDGSYVIPYFQRGFEWEPNMVSDLLESILRSYYTGIILFWDLDSKEAKDEVWDSIWGAKLKKEAPDKAILDGQQRLSSLYYAIYNPEEKFPKRKTYYQFYLDLNKILNYEFEGSVFYEYFLNYKSWDEIRSKSSEWIDKGIFPVSILSAGDFDEPNQKYIDSENFDDILKEYLAHNREILPNGTTTHKIYKIFNGILNYTFVFYHLSSERELPDICNIFARVNAKGMKLSTFDLMNAFLYPKGVKLRKELWDNISNRVLKNLDSNMAENLLKIISLKKQDYCSSRYLYNLIPGKKTLRKDVKGKRYEKVLVDNGDEFKDLWKDSVKYAEKARRKIMNTGDYNFGAIKQDFIPNTTILPVLSAVIWLYRDEIDLSTNKMLKKWYWSAVFSDEYGRSADSVMSKDFREWKEWIKTGKTIERIYKTNSKYIDELDLKKSRKGSARYNSILCLLTLNRVEDFFHGQIVGTGDYSNKRINDHHIFPAKVNGLDPENSKTFTEYKDLIVNRTLLFDETNNKIKNKLPSEYILDMEEQYGSKKRVEGILCKHFISKKSIEYLRDDNFDEFILDREKIIKDHMKFTLLD